MANWIRFERGGRIEFGTVHDDAITIHDGDMFAGARPTGARTMLEELVSLISRDMTLMPGDVIACGSRWVPAQWRSRKTRSRLSSKGSAS